MKQRRLLNIEILRVVAMFLIVTGHYWYNVVKTEPLRNSYALSQLGEYLASQTLFSFSTIGVNCFVMISGYFLILSKRFRYQGLLLIALQTVFYSLAVCGLFLAVPALPSPVLSDWAQALEIFPVHHHWFILKYMALMMVAPFLAVLVERLTQRQYLLLLLILFALLFEYPLGTVLGGGMSLSWFVFLFLFGGYLRLYPLPINLKQAVGLSVLILIGIVALHAVPAFLHGAPYELKFDGNHSVTFFLSALVFICFSRMNAGGRVPTLAGRLAPYMLGVYLLHEHWMVRPWLWKEAVPSVFGSYGVLESLCVALVVFAVCVVADRLRSRLFRLCRVNKVVEHLASRLPQPFER